MVNNCIDHALEAYLRRYKADTDPMIVRLLDKRGRCDSHWYYLSKEVVSTSAFDWDGRREIPKYEGPIQEAPREIRDSITQKRFMEEEFLMRQIRFFRLRNKL